MSCDTTDDILDLPVGTNETLEVEILEWSPTVSDPTTLPWRALVSATYTRWPGASPPLSDTGWFVASAVNRGTLSVPRYVVLVPVSALTTARYGVWVRVAGSAGTSPVRWSGVIRGR